MKFSIVIPTYNRADLISETLESCLAQSHEDFEILVVDDGSTDDTEAVVRKFRDSRLKYFKLANGERARARNFGWQQASGEYIVFLDSDDWMKKDCLLEMQGVIMDQKFPDLVALKYDFNIDGKIVPSTMEGIAPGWYNRKLFLKGNPLACNFAVKRTANLKKFPEARELASMEDWLFLLENTQDHPIWIAENYGVTMREHDQRSMANNRKVIASRGKAVDWAVKNISMSSEEVKELKSESAYFCAIHSYLEDERGDAFRYLLKSLSGGRFNTGKLMMLPKIVLGKRIVGLFK